jgi:hypothetical protein
MPFIRFLVSEYLAYCSRLIAIILLFSEIMPTCSCYTEKGLVCVIIIALFSCQPFFCSKYTKLNIYLSCNIYSVSDAEYIYLYSL